MNPPEPDLGYGKVEIIDPEPSSSLLRAIYRYGVWACFLIVIGLALAGWVEMIGVAVILFGE